jgi:hypothetical protein
MAPNGDDILITSIHQVFWCQYAELKEAEYNNTKEEIRQTQTRALTDAPAFDNIRKAPRQSLYNLYEYKTSCQFLKRRIFVVVAERNLRVRFCFRFCCVFFGLSFFSSAFIKYENVNLEKFFSSAFIKYENGVPYTTVFFPSTSGKLPNTLNFTGSSGK